MPTSSLMIQTIVLVLEQVRRNACCMFKIAVQLVLVRCGLKMIAVHELSLVRLVLPLLRTDLLLLMIHLYRAQMVTWCYKLTSVTILFLILKMVVVLASAPPHHLASSTSGVISGWVRVLYQSSSPTYRLVAWGSGLIVHLTPLRWWVRLCLRVPAGRPLLPRAMTIIGSLLRTVTVHMSLSALPATAS